MNSDFHLIWPHAHRGVICIFGAVQLNFCNVKKCLCAQIISHGLETNAVLSYKNSMNWENYIFSRLWNDYTWGLYWYTDLFDFIHIARVYLSVPCLHTYTPVSTVTSSLPLPGSGFASNGRCYFFF
jgi:hypothetical protein